MAEKSQNQNEELSFLNAKLQRALVQLEKKATALEDKLKENCKLSAAIQNYQYQVEQLQSDLNSKQIYIEEQKQTTLNLQKQNQEQISELQHKHESKMMELKKKIENQYQSRFQNFKQDFDHEKYFIVNSKDQDFQQLNVLFFEIHSENKKLSKQVSDLQIELQIQHQMQDKIEKKILLELDQKYREEILNKNEIILKLQQGHPVDFSTSLLQFKPAKILPVTSDDGIDV